MPRQFSSEDIETFKDLEVESTDVGLKNLISEQRKLNGALCQAIWAVLDALENNATGKDPSGKGRSFAEALKHARGLAEKVAEIPPGCNPKSSKT
jgi:hypothetical protein